MNIFRAKQYVQDTMLAHKSRSNSTNAFESIGLSLSNFAGSYNNYDIWPHIIGAGLHNNGFLEVAIDSDHICHDNACGNLHSELSRKFFLGGSNIVVYRRQRTDIQLVTGTRIAHQSLAQKKGWGTTGGFILPKSGGRNPRVFSNNHVLAASNKANIGDFVYQYTPGGYDVIGQLEKFVVINPVLANRLDLAVATVDYDIPELSGYLKPRRATLGEEVTKMGGTTGRTYGQVVSIDYTDRINYGGFDAIFTQQTRIMGYDGKVFSRPGDSGSLIYSTFDGAFVGLLFAGGSAGTFANPADLVDAQIRAWKY